MDSKRKFRTVAEGFHFLEAPRWHKGKLFFSDFYGGTVYAVDADDQLSTVCKWPKWVSGLGFTPDDDVLFVAVEERKLMRSAKGGKLTEVADLHGHAKHHCNDMLVDEKGRAYIGNFGFDVTPDGPITKTNLFMVSPDGKVSNAGGDLVFPNGMARSPDRRTLIVAETFAGRLSAFDIKPDGSLSGQRVWAAFADREFTTVQKSVDSGATLPDGIAVDAEDAVWAADAGGKGAVRVAAGGKILERISLPGLTSFAVALGGPDLKTLYLCAAPPLFSHDPTVDKKSVLLATRVEVPGVPT
jgi:sugar lactone lactonase YvrE